MTDNERWPKTIPLCPNCDDTFCDGHCDPDGYHQPEPIEVSPHAPAAELREAVERACHELGVPDDAYPAPVANAADILRQALARYDQAIAQEDSR